MSLVETSTATPRTTTGDDDAMSLDGEALVKTTPRVTRSQKLSNELMSHSSTSTASSPPNMPDDTPARTTGKKQKTVPTPKAKKPAPRTLSRSKSSASLSSKSSLLLEPPVAPGRKRSRQSLGTNNSDAGPSTPLKRRKGDIYNSTHVELEPSEHASNTSLESSWSLHKLGDLVWVKISSSGLVLGDNSSSGMWWPAKLKVADLPLITLLGPRTPAASGDKTQTVSLPGRHNLQSFRSKVSIRFNPKNFSSHDLQNSSVTDDWEEAFKDALTFDEGENDGLPDPDYIFSQYTPKTTRTLPSQSPQPPSTPVVEWKADSHLQPGVLVLSRDKTNGAFWPAKVKGVVAPTKLGARGKYHIIFFDGTEKNVSREWILTMDTDDFLTCRLGDIKSNGEEADDEEEDGRQTPLPRDPSPAPEAYISDEDHFAKLSLRQQVACIRPILQKIIADEYPWTADRHKAFMTGGKIRAELGMDVPTGDLSPADVGSVMGEVRRWALRGERWAQIQQDDGETAQSALQPDGQVGEHPEAPCETDMSIMPSEKVPRPKGSDEYERLGGSERSQYCADVLLPAALVLLEAIRLGLRKDRLVESDDASEGAIFKQAQTSLRVKRPVDGFLDTVLSIRMQRRIAKGLPATGNHEDYRNSATASPVKGTTRSRREYN